MELKDLKVILGVITGDTKRTSYSSPPAGGRGRQGAQILRVMKLTAIIIFAACLQVSAKTYSQITLSEKNITLQKIFAAIEKQTSYTFWYKQELLENSRKIDIEVKNANLESVLQIVFKDQPLTYSIVENTIVIEERDDLNIIQSGVKGPPPIDVHGKVVNEKGEAQASVTVTVKGTKNATATDINGEFILTGVDASAILVFTSTNIETFEIRVNGKTDLAINLKTKVSALDEVQIIAYGTTTRRLSTGNISTVKGTDIEKQPVSNPLLALEGRVPGLFITQATGLAGSAVTVRIQGQNSIGSGNEPLYVVDGMPYSSQLLSSAPDYIGSILGSASGTQSNGSPLSYINPADIESIDVLKDADATAIYGSRAANGAILITTKKGKAGQTKVDINIQSGWGKVTRKLDLLNTQQYIEMRHEAYKNDVATPSGYSFDVNGTWDTTRYTDWQKELIGGTAKYTNVQATISGGNATTQYLIGGGYHKETTVFPGNFADQKGSLHFNINSISPNQKFRVLLSGNYLVDNNQLPSQDLTSSALHLAPNAPQLYNTDGSLNWAQNASGITTWPNGDHPLEYTLRNYETKGKNLISNAVLSYQVLPGLEIKSSFGYTNLQTNEMYSSPLVSIAPENRPYSSRVAIYGNNTISSWIIEPQVSYKKTIGNGRLEALLGTTILQNNSNGQVLFCYGYNSDAVLKDIRSATSVSVDASTASLYKYNALFGRINYNLQERYIVNLTARRDGSGRFGPKNQFHNFGSIGGAWIFNKEEFIQTSLPWLSFGKLRGSYGTTGNDQIGDYQFLNLFSPLGVDVPYQGVSGLLPNGLTNPYLQWEETKKLQFGLDVGLLKDRILFSVNYFHNRSSNQLLGYSLPIITGFSGITRNFPATVQNSGWEFSLNTINLKTKDLNWSSSFNLTIPKNKLVAFSNLATSTYANSLIIGQPITIVKAFHFLGVDPATGVYKFDSKADQFNPAFPDDATILINTSPKFYGGLQNSVSYKGIQLDISFQFVKQIGANYFFGYYVGANVGNQPTSVLGRWQKPGDITSIQRYNSNYSLSFLYNNGTSVDAYYSDASYIRLKNLSLSWQLPESWRKKAHFQNCRLYMQGQNLLTITNYKGLDPETLRPGSTPSLPPLRVLTMGIQITL